MNCVTCRYWSEMVAQAWGAGPMEALCLSETGPKAGKYTTEKASCEAWKSGHHGAVDSPPNYGEEARAAYEAEEVTP
jgi:hypothetical protein